MPALVDGPRGQSPSRVLVVDTQFPGRHARAAIELHRLLALRLAGIVSLVQNRVDLAPRFVGLPPLSA